MIQLGHPDQRRSIHGGSVESGGRRRFHSFVFIARRHSMQAIASRLEAIAIRMEMHRLLSFPPIAFGSGFQGKFLHALDCFEGCCSLSSIVCTGEHPETRIGCISMGNVHLLNQLWRHQVTYGNFCTFYYNFCKCSRGSDLMLFMLHVMLTFLFDCIFLFTPGWE